jgi:hypothetical protein
MLQLEQDQLYAQTQDQLNICMRITEIVQPSTESIGPAPRGVCSRPASALPASWLSSCKSQGKKKRTGARKQKIGNKTVRVANKRIKGQKYGGPLPDYSR